MDHPPPSPITDLYFPHFSLPTALHRRASTFYIVFPRAYGMANGNKLFAQLNCPQPKDPTPDPPKSQSHLNPRFWHREGSSGTTFMAFDQLMGVEPRVFKDVGLRRKVLVKEGSGREVEVEERLVEVLVKEEEYCQRCAWCGVWEYSYEKGVRHKRLKEQAHGVALYWCGDCSMAPKLWLRYWWQNPENLDDGLYFYCKLP
ncbi:hypothetical protein CC86DRAFT_453554 [Ophiobolus disseminans]|uniref:Uncharacterized protein n=1 Tax=Ophiobolus disseminans TaxID=1469910 RepID=A0A6A7ABG3_9PLEO|nr:hypothetical protein CC86DRAFT_453554 [Ophiobolus disseminans]